MPIDYRLGIIGGFQIFFWQGNNKLGNIKQLVIDLKIFPLTD